jgi:hypothetical protein
MGIQHSGLRLLGDPASAPTTRKEKPERFRDGVNRSAALMGKGHSAPAGVDFRSSSRALVCVAAIRAVTLS